MYQALYRKWRPQTFDDVYGQEHITSILKYETEHNKFSHAYLFCGSRGTGKTTCAKILAKAVNCESPVNGSPCNQCPSCRSIDNGSATDVLEMDAASNNGVDNIRDIRDEVVYTPSALKYRVYIVDEVHMLSGSAFNALLKTLEEPPAHVVFILATTELHKLPSTIISRCQRFDFRRITTPVLVDRLSLIAKEEGIEHSGDALRIIAKMAQGGMRDAISLLELCAGNRTCITPELVNDTLGSGGRESIEKTVRAIASGNFDTIFGAVDAVVSSSKDISVFWQDLISFYRDMLVIKTTDKADKYLDLTEIESENLAAVSALFTKETLLWHCRVLDDTFYALQRAGASKRSIAEMALVKMCNSNLDTSADAILSRLSKLEAAVAEGRMGMVSAPAPTPKTIETIKPKEETPKTSGAAAENTPQPASKTAEAPQIASDSSLKIMRGWNEVIEKAMAGDGAMLALLKQGKAFTDGNKVYIRFANKMIMSMVDNDNIKNKIRAAICVVRGIEIAPTDLVFGVFEGNEDTVTDLDELQV